MRGRITRYTLLWSTILVTVVLGQNWEVNPILSSPGDWMPVAIATDSLCQPHVAFGVSGFGVIGYACRDGDTWDFDYPDSGVISSIELCLDTCDHPHMGYVASRYPEANELRYAYGEGDSWHVETVARGTELPSLVLARDGTPHLAFIDSAAQVTYARKVGNTWHHLTVPASQPDTLRLLSGTTLALDTGDRPGVAVTWWKAGSDDSLWLSFFEYDGQDWNRFDVDSTEGWAPWDFWPVRVRCDPTTDLFHVVYRAYRYAVGKGEDWQIQGTSGKTAGNVFCDFVLHGGRPHIACASPWDPITYQWQWAGGWGTEMVVYRSTPHNPSIAVDRTGRPHIAFQDGDTLYYARRLVVGTEEPPARAQPESQPVIRPNPAPHTFAVELTAARRTVAAITLSDASGRTVLLQKVSVEAGHFRHRIALPASVKPGVYFCTFDDGCCKTSRKVVLTD